MKQQFLKFLATAAIVILSITAANASVKVEVNEAAELTAALMRLAGYEEYNLNDCADYASELDSILKPHANHPAVEFAKQIRKSGIGYDAVAELAFTLEVSGDSIRFNPLLAPEKMLDERWYFPTAQKMAGLIDQFYRDSRFNQFFVSHKPFYDKSVANMHKMLGNVDFDWLSRFYGVSYDNMIVHPSFTNDGNYGMSLTYKDGNTIFSPWICPYEIDENGVPEYVGNEGIIIHEGTHPVTNPLVDKYKSLFNNNSERAFELRKESLGKRAYGDSKAVLYETLVRACNKKYDMDHAQSESDSLQVLIRLRQETNDFLIEEAIYDALGEYELNRDKYKTLCDFFPRIAEVHNATSPDSVLTNIIRRAPKIIKFNIKDGEVLQPGEHELTFTFDKPVVRGFGLGYFKGREFPETEENISRSDDKTTYTVKLILEPGKEYGIAFPGWFGSEDCYYSPETVYLKFSTSE